MIRTIAIDFETFYSSKLKYTLRTMIAEQYVRHELFDPYLLSVCDGSQTWVGSPRDFNWAALDGVHVVAHNYGFDGQVLSEMQRRGWIPKLNFVSANCTANLAAYDCNRRALDHAVEFLYGVKLSKTMRSNADGKTWKDFSPEQQRDMAEYARKDSYWCHKLWTDHSLKWPVSEQRLSIQTILQGIKGLQTDVSLLNNFLMQTHEARENTTKLIPWIAEAEEDETAWEGFNSKPTSTKCIAEQCRRVGIPCPPVKADDEDAFAAWEETYSPKHPWIGALTAWRSLNKLYKTCVTMKDRLRPDGTMPFELKYAGAHTLRWSGAGRLNLQNFRRLPLIVRADGQMEQDDLKVSQWAGAHSKTGVWPTEVRHAVDLRNVIIPRPGKRMISCDLAQIEPRVLSWLAGDTETLELVRNGCSLYEAYAKTAMGWTGTDLKKEDSSRYSLIKAVRLGLGYGCGWRKFIVVARNMAGIDITKDDPEWIEAIDPTTGNPKQISGYGTFSRRIVKEFRDSNPKIKALWERLDAGLKCSIGNDFEVALPSGRSMIYRAVRASVTIEPDPETGKPRRKNIVTADIGGVRYPLYGGLIVENITQAIARDVFAYHLLKLEDAGLPPLFSCHDEAILEVDADAKVSDIARIMSITPPWLPGCPIAAEAKEIERYCK